MTNKYTYYNFFDKSRRFFKNEHLHDKFHEKILNILESKCAKIINNYQDTDLYLNNNSIFKREIAWMMWWQGETKFPPLVKKCFENNKKYLDNIIVITEQNYLEYIDIPENILDKVSKGIISLTQLSDIIRVNLLYKYGGLWLDATIFLNDFNFVEISKKKYWTLSGYDFFKGKYVSKGRWRGFVQYSDSNLVVQSFMVDMFNYYWEIENELINFFLIDYFYAIAYKYNIGKFQEMINSIEPCGKDVYKLDEHLMANIPIDIDNLSSNVFKLNLKHDYLKYNKDENSFFKKFLQ